MKPTRESLNFEQVVIGEIFALEEANLGLSDGMMVYTYRTTVYFQLFVYLR